MYSQIFAPVGDTAQLDRVGMYLPAFICFPFGIIWHFSHIWQQLKLVLLIRTQGIADPDNCKYDFSTNSFLALDADVILCHGTQ